MWVPDLLACATPTHVPDRSIAADGQSQIGENLSNEDGRVCYQFTE